MAGRTEKHTEGVLGLADCENVSAITDPEPRYRGVLGDHVELRHIFWSSGSPGWNGDVLGCPCVPMVPPDSRLTYSESLAGEVDANA